ncbi:mobile element protein [Caldimonas brevitalea]|uniref:Mobile element protein n=1 Tax=Caldimonas brevitalea TaxID=413882 RepID=A0A0G3BCP4_9BURK|nr:mobile element protein [Caldimonas brevitalea]
MAGPNLLAHVLVSKFADHLPLYRQSEIYAREGVELERSTLADWVGSASRLLEPLLGTLQQYVLGAEKLHADDTPVAVLAPGKGRTKTGRLWAYVRDERPMGSLQPPAVWFQYSPDRKGERPQEHLKQFTGILQADRYAGFEALYEQGRVVEAACWAHARRKFFELHQATKSPQALEALRRIGELYEIERHIRGRPPEERWRVRQEHAVPKLQALRGWMDDVLAATWSSLNLPGRFATRWAAGLRSSATRRTGGWRSITTRPSARSEP